jgi:MoCo/4Fe-4S cofactor protein with predicted Tat translocation signal
MSARNRFLSPRDLTAFGAPLKAAEGRSYWRSLEEWADTDEFRDFLEHEFPHWADLWRTPISRRDALKLMAASLALAGLAGCGRQTDEEIVPYVRAPEQIVPGKPLFYATAVTCGGYAQGVLVESQMGRPIKVEGNPLHPASLGATDIFGQAAVLGLYDPDRSQMVTNGGEPSSWEAFLADLSAKRGELAARSGDGLYVLTETVASPTLGQQLEDLLRTYPQAQWHQYDPLSRDSVRAGAQLAFGETAETLYRFDQAAVILSLDADFLASQPGHLRYAHDFSGRRRVRRGQASMNRLYAVESTPTLTGSMADHRLPLAAGRMEALTRVLARKLGLDVAMSEGPLPVPETWLDAVIRDLQIHRGASVVVTGDHQSPVVHALAQAMNQRLGNFGRTVIHIDPVEILPANPWDSLSRLVADMKAGTVDTLLVLGGNPVFDAPADADFAEALKKVPLRIHWGLYADETAHLCHWHIPASHELESWGDARAYDGTITIQQPLIAPVFGGRSAHEVLARFMGESGGSSHDIVKTYWRKRHSGPDFEEFWRQTLRDGLVYDSSSPTRHMSVRDGLAASLPQPQPVRAGELELQFRADPTIWDGRYANHGWLQELPKPLTKLTWDNPALLGPHTARRLGLRNGEVVELSYGGRRLSIPVWIMPGHADDSLTLHLGYGRSRAGRVGTGTGFNTYALRTSAAPWFDDGLRIEKAEPRGLFGIIGRDRVTLASTQHHHSMHGHDLVREMTPAQFQAASPMPQEPQPDSMYPDYPYSGYAWGMVIDQNACMGCNACVIACQAENNIPIVGKDEVQRGREMHWLRIDRYYSGAPENPKTHFQPVPCMQCERAPCEPVCPVHASVHDAEGINNQVYNRCVGTRTCQSNCPYKVRRFNFFEYTAARPTNEGAPSLAALRNPDVTVRSRGVMEKCTYCIQRINAARIEAEKEDRPIRDGEAVTACQAVCPTRAIAFGNINDPNSRVVELKAQPHHYALLEELNTKPRTTYLARLRNPNPELKDG